MQYLKTFESLGSCDWQDSFVGQGALVFGWQFRPVLGETYVKGGQRQVFAQLSLPVDLQGQYVPRVVVQTRWRQYNPKTQTVGTVYKDSCSQVVDRSGVMLANTTHVDDMSMLDLGGGQISLKAQGQFYSSSLGVIAGASTLVPHSFDGKSIEVIAPAHDLLEASELTIVDPNGQQTPFAVKPNDNRACGITSAAMKAVPYPDGNSRATLSITLGGDFNISANTDRPPHPLVMIGDSVFGLKETPYLDSGGLCFTVTGGGNTSTQCQYNFIVPTTALRNAQIFQLRDLSWYHFAASGRVAFAPSFSSLAVLSAADSSGGAAATSHPRPTTASSPHSAADAPNPGTIYTITGFDFSRIKPQCNTGESLTPCLNVFAGETRLPTDKFHVQSDNTATMTLTAAELGKTKAIRFQLDWDASRPTNLGNRVEWSLNLPKDQNKTVASPAFLRAGDSQLVSFTGGDLCSTVKNYSVAFEGIPLPTPHCSGNTLQVTVTTTVTKLPGHKDFTLSAAGAPVQSGGAPVLLSVDVFKQ
jgi:hypothetical protein